MTTTRTTEAPCRNCGSTRFGKGTQGARKTCRGCGVGVDQNGYPDMVGYLNAGNEDCPADDLAPLWDAALPADAPGAWIRAAIESLRDA